MTRIDKTGRRIYVNQICAALREYREDFKANRSWWLNNMNARGNNGYLAVKFKNGDCLTIDSEYLSFEDTRKFPHLLASEIEYLSRYWGEGSETITAEDIVIDTDEIRVFEKGEEVFRYEMTLDEFRKMRKTLWDEEIEDPALYIIDFCRNLVNSKRNK